jgi:hypothetical protein
MMHMSKNNCPLHWKDTSTYPYHSGQHHQHTKALFELLGQAQAQAQAQEPQYMDKQVDKCRN